MVDGGGPARPRGPVPGVPARIGRYEVRAVLGNGAFGRVYHAFDTELHRDVAIKVPHPHGLSPVFRERFLREARAAATIHHPNVCPVYEAGTDGDVPYIVMHFVPGGTLAGVLAQRDAPLSVRTAVARAPVSGRRGRGLRPAGALAPAAAEPEAGRTHPAAAGGTRRRWGETALPGEFRRQARRGVGRPARVAVGRPWAPAVVLGGS